MCTLIALWRSVAGYDLMVGMNRDESANRPSDPPSLLEGDPVIVAFNDWSRRYTIVSGKEDRVIRVGANVNERVAITTVMKRANS